MIINLNNNRQISVAYFKKYSGIFSIFQTKHVSCITDIIPPINIRLSLQSIGNCNNSFRSIWVFMRSIYGSMLPAWKTQADACFACACSVSPCGGHVPHRCTYLSLLYACILTSSSTTCKCGII